MATLCWRMDSDKDMKTQKEIQQKLTELDKQMIGIDPACVVSIDAQRFILAWVLEEA